jgi:hypothetical protein
MINVCLREPRDKASVLWCSFILCVYAATLYVCSALNYLYIMIVAFNPTLSFPSYMCMGLLCSLMFIYIVCVCSNIVCSLWSTCMYLYIMIVAFHPTLSLLSYKNVYTCTCVWVCCVLWCSFILCVYAATLYVYSALKYLYIPVHHDCGI